MIANPKAEYRRRVLNPISLTKLPRDSKPANSHKMVVIANGQLEEEHAPHSVAGFNFGRVQKKAMKKGTIIDMQINEVM